jgi:uncharacterized protein with NRDE domain
MGKHKELDHEKFMRDKGIEAAELPEQLKEADTILKKAKKEDFEAANDASKLIVEALQESIYELNETVEQIGETLADHEGRILGLEEWKEKTEKLEQKVEVLEEKVEENTEEIEEEKNEDSELVLDLDADTVANEPIVSLPKKAQKSQEEQILAKLYTEGEREVGKPKLKELGFNVGFFSKLSSRGGRYGNYELQKLPGEKTYQILKIS